MDMDWRVYAKKADFSGIGEKYDIDPVVARVITNRGITGGNIGTYLHGSLTDVHDPHDMADVEKGCMLICDSINKGRLIRIVGDYDVDGIVSTYILYDGLRRLGADVSYEIPDRINDGYGINSRIIREAHEAGVSTIVTCDNGIAAFEALELAGQYGMRVVVTDHHELKYSEEADGKRNYKWVPADAVIDIKRPDCQYPFKEICGATVAYKTLRVLYELMGVPWGETSRYIEFVALATQCDVMSLTDENRIYVKHGLEIFGRTNNTGLRALIAATGMSGKKISSYHLGFVFGPCLNSTGRLESAREGLALLLEEDETKAALMARRIAELNESRKIMTVEATDMAAAIVDEKYADDKVLVICLPDIHESIAGIIAGRIRERYYRPTYILSRTKKGMLKGSGRSIKGYNMFEELNSCGDLFTAFGGHELAAGFSLEEGRLDEMRLRLNLAQHMTTEQLTPRLMIDVPMPMSYPAPKLVTQLSLLEPFGKDNEKPVFAEAGLRIERVRLVGRDGRFAQISFLDRDGNRINGIDFDANNLISCIKLWFGEQECDKMLKGEPNNIRIDVAYTPDINEYNGKTAVQVRPLHYRRSK